MSVDLLIEYKDRTRADVHHPFASYRVLTEGWWPLAASLHLETLKCLECLFITKKEEAEMLVVELKQVQTYLQSPGQRDISPEVAAHMLDRIRRTLPLIEQAVAEWDAVAELSI
ncbi:MAG TPA: hypothetical protein PKE58_18695 [Acidobacteriota bacterium]|nr:hypothetical protein [Acidobacteriota bacterium]